MKTGSPPRLRARLRYRLDLALSRGLVVVVGYLGLTMVAIIVLAALIQTALGLVGVNGDAHGLSFGEAFWQSMLRVLDTGTMATDTHWATRLLSLLVTLSGIFLAGSLIGLIANAVDQWIQQLRKGRSIVIEADHTVVLGWSDRLPAILAELVIANANHPRQAVVVLADRAKDEMEDELRRLVPDTQTTRVVCRTGDISAVADLHLVNITRARSVIVLAGDSGDAGVVKTVLAVRSIDPEFASIRLVAELDDADYADTLRALTGNRIATVRADDVISQVTAQACHQSGLAAVFRDLLDFDGDEIYFQRIPEITGHRYAEVVTAFDRASVLGLCRDGKVTLNPSADTLVEFGDELIAIAEDDDKVVFTGFTGAAAAPVAQAAMVQPTSRIAVIGWSGFGVAMLGELDEFLAHGSRVDVLVDAALCPPAEIVLPEFSHCRVEVRALPPGPAAMLAQLGREVYDQAIVLGYRGRLTPAEADSRSMLTLLALDRAWAGRATRPRVVAEMLEGSNVKIAQTTGVDDFIVSDELSSLMIAQLSERLELQDVFDELFGAEGCYLSLQPAPLFAPATPTTFGTVVATALAHGAAAVGYRPAGSAVVLNPAKSTPLTLGPNDEVLVVARRDARADTAPAPAPVALDAAEPRSFAPVAVDRGAVGTLGTIVTQPPRITELPRADGMAALNGDNRIRPNPSGRHRSG